MSAARRITLGDGRVTSGELVRNLPLLDIVNRTAAGEGITPAQLVLAWFHHPGQRLGVATIPIPGTRRPGPLYISQGRELLEPDRFPAATRTDNAATIEGAFRA